MLAGMDEERRRLHGQGWTIPASQLKYGEEPRAAARRIGEEILQIRGMTYSEPRVETDLYEPRRFPGRVHYDIWFLVDGTPPKGRSLKTPPWYAELAPRDPKTPPAAGYSRGPEGVVVTLPSPLPRP